MNKINYIIALLFISHFVSAQNSNDNYTIENTWGITKNTASGLIAGIVFKKSIRNPTGNFTTYGIELVNYKHPAQLKWITGTGNSYTLGKVNHLFAIRGQYGRDYILFKKAPQQGVQISLNLSIGPSIGLEAPYYVEYQTIRVPYDPLKHAARGDITGRGFIFQGLFESNIIIGANIKASLSFEFGALKSSVSGFEAGFLLDAYTRKVNMMATPDNYAVWPTVFITLFYGSRK
ncbi:MAG: hypothetical protein L3J06_09220 [Cyclobacteriaceae bacterium]|nr:hypothetical protein [Cyclobacteriaceae bacterium]